MFKDKTLLITGGTGSFGNAVLRRFIGTDIGEIRIFSRDEKKQDDMRTEYKSNKIKFFVGDVRNYNSIDFAMKDVDYVFHAAALKQVPIISTHPRTRKKLESKDFEFNNLAEFMKPLGFADYIKLQSNAFCTVSDSGTITEEASLLRFPAVTIRQAHERPEGMDEGTLIMSGLNPQDITDAVDCVIEQAKHNPEEPRVVSDYTAECVSQKVVRIIMSYTKYIRRTVWRDDV